MTEDKKKDDSVGVEDSFGENAKGTFWASFKSVCHTAKVIFRLDALNIPSFVGDQFFITLQPFVALFFSARILDALASGAERGVVVRWIVAAVACNYGVYLLERLMACLSSLEGITLYWQLYQEMSRVMMRADYKELEKPDISHAKERIDRATNMFWYGPWEVPGVFMRLIEGLTITVSSLVLAFPIFLPVKGEKVPWGMLGMILFIGVSVWYSLSSERKLYKMKEDSLEPLAQVYRQLDFFTAYAEEGKAAKDLRLFGQKKLIHRLMEKNLNKERELTDVRRFKQAKSYGIRGALAQAVGCLAYLVVGARALAGIFGIGSVVQYVGAIMKLSEGIRVLIYALQHITMQGPHCQEYLDFIGEGEDKKKYCHEQDGQRILQMPEEYTITFEHVSFRYPGSEEWVLKDLNMTLKRGEHFAVVGMNGSGKTTFIKLLCRLYEPEQGRILLNGTDIREFRYEDYQRLFAVVFQDFQIFALPLGENVAASCHYDEARVRACLEQAGVGEFVNGLPKGLEQPLYTVEADGVNISGGEAQKIAIARALYKDAPFVILDEPTAALDPIAEAEIYAGFQGMVQSKGALYISHRLSSCRFCDTIAVFHEGRLVQMGSHEELLEAEDGKYYELWHAQAQYYRRAECV